MLRDSGGCALHHHRREAETVWRHHAQAPAQYCLRNIAENPAVTVVVDHYDENWEKLGWVMLRGRAEILTEGGEHDDAQALLRSRYPQLQPMLIAQHPVIAIRIERTISWGNLSVAALA